MNDNNFHNLDKNKVHCYKCKKEMNIIFNELTNNEFYICKDHESKNNYILIYSKKYQKWLTTRNKNINESLISAENAYQKRLDKINETIKTRENEVKKFNEEFKYYIKNENDNYGFVKCICSKCNSNFETRYDHFLERINNDINKENENIKWILCSDCSKEEGNINGAKTRSGAGICSGCGKPVESRDSCCLCSECRSKKSSKDRKENEKPGHCISCGRWNEKRNNVGLGKECGCSQLMYSQRGMKLKFCKKCNKETLHNESKCLICYPESKPGGGIEFKKCINGKDHKCLHISGKCSICENMNIGFESNFKYLDILTYKNEPVDDIINKLNSGIYDIKDFPGWNLRYCNNCQKFEWHYGTECLICDNKNKLINSKFIEIKGVKHYMMPDKSLIDCKMLSDKILKNELNIANFPGFNIRFGRVCKDTEDIITGEIYKLNNSNFVNFKGVEHVLDHSTNEYIPSDKFFNNFDKKVKNLVDSNNEIQKFIDYEEFSVEPIIKISEDMWNRNQTDKNLAYKGYGWIVYIKLFHGKPWIVGKTGTTLVSASPVDFDFRIYNPDDLDDTNYNGPGRTYVHRYYPDELYSDFDYVLVKGFEIENEAKEYEKYIGTKYNLFYS